MYKDPGKKFLSDLKLYSDYLKWDSDKKRYETWEEGVDKILNTHAVKYGPKIASYLDEVRTPLYNKEFLTSQRNLQYRGEQVFKHMVRMYNCSTTYAYTPDVFSKGFYVLLCGAGLGVSLRKKFVSQLPPIYKKQNPEKVVFTVEDSIEGWAEAAHVLISSFCRHSSLYPEFFNKEIIFDFAGIRPKGAFISGGFRAPGPEGLRQSLERINILLEANPGEFRSIIAYDIFMHMSDAVLSGGVRRSAMNVVIDEDDTEMLHAKTGDWYTKTPWRARSNNSVGLYRDKFSKEKFEQLVGLNDGISDIGFVITNNEDEIFNPCYEINFAFYDKIKDKSKAVFQLCNLCEINASASVDSNGNFSEETFYRQCRNATIIGTLQAGYTEFPYLGKQTEEIVAGEALLGVSITGWMARPELFNPEILRKGAQIVLETNAEVADVIGINHTARATTVKPSGNASVILGTPSGIHPEHSQRYFRIMQLNKESEVAKYLEVNRPECLEESRWSATNSDYVVYVPCENQGSIMSKEDMQRVKHLELIKLVQQNWVIPGTREELCYYPETRHNVSNTVIIDNLQEIVDYLYTNQKYFTAVSFLVPTGDKDYKQAPFTSVLMAEELLEKYGNAAIFASGLIVDGLHYFNGDLWRACDHIINRSLLFKGSRDECLLQKDWVRRAKKFAKNYFKGSIENTIYCLKDVHLFHKWNIVKRDFKPVDFSEILTEPTYQDVSDYAAIACSGGSCEI